MSLTTWVNPVCWQISLLNTSSNCNHLHKQVLLTTSISVLRGGGSTWQGSDQVLHASPSRWQLHTDHGRGERQRQWSFPHSEWEQKCNQYKCSHAVDPWALAMLIRINEWRKKGLLLEVANGCTVNCRATVQPIATFSYYLPGEPATLSGPLL